MIDFRRDATSLSCQFPASLKLIDEVSWESEIFLRQIGLDRVAFGAILSLREALSNAVLHGCGADAGKFVNLKIAKVGNALELTVGDEGPGFDWQRAISRDLPTTEESGRGIAIMRRYFESLRYNPEGNVLILSKII